MTSEIVNKDLNTAQRYV